MADINTKYTAIEFLHPLMNNFTLSRVILNELSDLFGVDPYDKPKI